MRGRVERRRRDRCVAVATTAGTSRTPAADRAARSPRSSAVAHAAQLGALQHRAGCISHAAAAITHVSGSASERPPANAWRKAASANATVRPICLA